MRCGPAVSASLVSCDAVTTHAVMHGSQPDAHSAAHAPDTARSVELARHEHRRPRLGGRLGDRCLDERRDAQPTAYVEVAAYRQRTDRESRAPNDHDLGARVRRAKRIGEPLFLRPYGALDAKRRGHAKHRHLALAEYGREAEGAAS